MVPLQVDDEDVIVSVWRADHDGSIDVSVTPVEPHLRPLRDVLIDPLDSGQDRRLRLTWSDLAPLGTVLPAAMHELLSDTPGPVRLTIVPTSWLWAAPFAAIPLDQRGDRLLVDAADIVLTPSLRFASVMARRERSPVRARAAVSWSDPGSGIAAAEIDRLRSHPGGHLTLATADQVRDAFVRGGPRWQTAVSAAPGNRAPGLAQAAVAGGRPVLAAAHFLDGAAAPPAFVSLASCHSGYPEADDPGEPLGLALAALAAGTEHVLAGMFELDARAHGPLTRCLGELYDRVAVTNDVPAALADVLRDPVARGRRRPEPLYRWAALAVIGAHLP